MNTNNTSNIDKKNNKFNDNYDNKFIYEEATKSFIQYHHQSILQSSSEHNKEIFLYNAGSIIVQLYILKEIISFSNSSQKIDQDIFSLDYFTDVYMLLPLFSTSFLLPIVFLVIKSTFYLLRSNKLAKHNFYTFFTYTIGSTKYSMTNGNSDKEQELELLRLASQIEDKNMAINKLFNKSHYKTILAMTLLGSQLFTIATIIVFNKIMSSYSGNFIVFIIAISVALAICAVYFCYVKEIIKQAKGEIEETIS